MLPYTIDDPISDPLTDTVEVTIDFGGHKRWLFFITPLQLSAIGDCVEGTTVRMHLGELHMIVVSELTTEVIDRVLRQLHEEGQLEGRTISLN